MMTRGQVRRRRGGLSRSSISAKTAAVIADRWSGGKGRRLTGLAAGDVIDIKDYAATVIGGTLRPGDDAADARWVDPEDLGVLAVTEGLVEALTEWGVLRQEPA